MEKVVTSSCIQRPGDHFWSHPIRGSHQGLHPRDIFADLCRTQKSRTSPVEWEERGRGEESCEGGGGCARMGRAYPAVESQQDGVTLDVPVDGPWGVKVSQGLQHNCRTVAICSSFSLDARTRGHQQKRMLALAGAAGEGWAGLVPTITRP